MIKVCQETNNVRQVFSSQKEYESFRKSYRENVTPRLQQHAQAHHKSQERAKKRRVS